MDSFPDLVLRRTASQPRVLAVKHLVLGRRTFPDKGVSEIPDRILELRAGR